MKKRSIFGWIDMLTGVALLIIGVATLLNPKMAASGLVIFLGIAAIISGASAIAMNVRIRRFLGFASGISLFMGIVVALSGILLIIYPGVGSWILNILLSVWIISHCISRIAAFDLTQRFSGKTTAIIMLCLNILGLFLGVLMIFNSSIFTMSIGVLVGVSLILVGSGNIMEAFSGIGASDIN